VGSEAEYAEAIRGELEDRDYYTQKNVFWVPALAGGGRCRTAPSSARHGKSRSPRQEETYKITSTGRLIDDALEAHRAREPEAQGRAQQGPTPSSSSTRRI